MKNRINIFLILLFLFAMSSCYKDKGNYTYEESNKIEIKGIDNIYSLDITDEQNEGIKLEPKLEFEKEPISKLNYKWSIEGVEFSTDKNITLSKDNITEDSNCRFEVITKEGNHFIKDFQVKLSSSFAKGWLLLTKEESINYLTFVKSEDKETEDGQDKVEYKVYEEIYKKINSSSLGSDAIKMSEHWNGSNDYSLVGNIIIIKQDGEGTIEINGSTLLKECRTADYFLDGILPFNFKPIDEFYTTSSSVILDENGNIYSRKFSTKELFQSGKYMNEPVYFDQGLDIKMIIPSLFKEVYCGLLFDKKNRRLLYFDENSKIGKLNYENYDDGVSDLNDLEKDVIYGGYHNISDWGKNLEYTIVLRDDANNYSIANFKLAFESVYVFVGGKLQEVTQLEVKDPYENKFDFSDKINESSVFCRPRNRQYMYFSSDNKLYAYDLNTKENPILLHTFKNGIITDICSGYDTKQIGVVTDSGEFSIIDTSISKIANPEDNVIYNYVGDKKIIDLLYKYGSKNNISF